MPPKKRKTTHVPVKLSINLKRKGKVENNEINLFPNSADSNISNCETSTSKSDLENPDIPPIDISRNLEPKANQYYDQRRKEIGAWQDQRAQMLQSLLERGAPTTNDCVICKSKCSSPIRCLECSSTYTACVACALKDHELRPLHSLEIWKVC